MLYTGSAHVVETADDDRRFWGRRSFKPAPAPAPATNGQPSASERFRRALTVGNPRQVRAAAAELPDIGVTEAAAILIVIERTEPENYEPTALRWLAQLATAGTGIDLGGIADAAAALAALPYDPRARERVAAVCRAAGLKEAAAVFAHDQLPSA